MESGSLAARVDARFAAGGPLRARWPRYEEREGQRALARGIAATVERGGVLLAEAPTGIGKSLAYLLPCVLRAAESGERVVIATCTRSLQDQLFERDLPFLLAALGIDLPCVRLKGKQNYLCTRRLDLLDGNGPEEERVIDALKGWALEPHEGDLDRFEAADGEALRRVRGRVGADPHACTSATCGRGRECHWFRARRLAAQAKVLVVNHALLALSGEVEGLLPDFDVLVVDEAHRLEGVLVSQLEVSVSRHRFEEALRLVGAGRTGAGLAARMRGALSPLMDGERAHAIAEEVDRLAQRVADLRRALDPLFKALEPREAGHPVYGVRRRYRKPAELWGQDLQPLETVLEHCGALARALGRAAQSWDSRGSAPDLVAELDQVGATWAGLGRDLERLGMASVPDWVYWRTSGGRGLELHGAPVSVSDHARRLVLGRPRATILTSATLAAGKDFAFVAERLGLGEAWRLPYETARVDSPFQLERQMRTFVHEPLPDEPSGIARLVEALSLGTGRNLLALFTAHERMRRARERLVERLGDSRLVLAQDWDGPAGLLAERFRRERGAILLGVQSLWEGVDFPGEALEILVVAKLPFSVPDDPVVEARAERMRDQGLDPFREDAVPEAVLRFRQGVGRLIRRADDRGVLVVCDTRLAGASYRRPFLEALPAAPRVIRDVSELADEAARFLSGGDPDGLAAVEWSGGEVPVEDRT